ncbi:MAG TPA: universal stress protein [Acidimicrobiales bacterium]|nr:universal stress protein [Acidimicrobiales bacterium]
MYTHIVVGTDGSATATAAVRHAAALASVTGATLHVVHVFQPMSAMATMGIDGGAAAASAGVGEETERRAHEVLDQALELARAEGASAEGHLTIDDPANALIDTAANIGADLLVVGNKGMSGVKRFVLGSVPNKVSHHSPCSLLIVNTAS